MDLKQESAHHLTEKLIPFWTGLRDQTYGGYYGQVGFDLRVNPSAPKGCIQNSRILWFFSTAYTLLNQPELLEHARHAYRFFERFSDSREGGLYWMCAAEGEPLDDSKHTYCHAFAVYALSAYARAAGDARALERALELFELIETRMVRDGGYLEAFDRGFRPLSNEKLGGNDRLLDRGVVAEKTMNTLLHVLEAYTLLYRVSLDSRVGDRLRRLLDLMRGTVYNREKNRLDVFFDREMQPLIDMQSYGHDIEASWLIDLAAQAVYPDDQRMQTEALTTRLALGVLERAFREDSLLNECVEGEDDPQRIWWVQAETMVGMANLWQKTSDPRIFKNMRALWGYIQSHMVDPRRNAEWYAEVDEQGNPVSLPVVEPWKCPYHNGRMCMELIRRL